MRRPVRDDRATWIGPAALGLAVILLGGQVRQTVVDVLSVTRGTGASGPGAANAGAPAWKSVTARDGLVERSHMGPRDPFRLPPARSMTRERGPAAPEPAPAPRLSSLLFDNVAPSVQLTVGEIRSGWLKAGEVFQGWTVVEIGRASVKVTDGSRTLVLAAS
ncbi:MAG: hypothetical protein HZB25_05950 [Candidatus Eisenbacteria bacterium]|nr:hypothetical protein [Candidatus Eisenbacteria bacterium]